MTPTFRRTSSAASAGSRSGNFQFTASPLNDETFSFDVTKLAQTLPKPASVRFGDRAKAGTR